MKITNGIGEGGGCIVYTVYVVFKCIICKLSTDIHSTYNINIVNTASIVCHVPIACIAEGSLEVTLPTIWTDGKADVGRVSEKKEEGRRRKKKEERRKKKKEERRRKKKKEDLVHEKVEKSRNTLFSRTILPMPCRLVAAGASGSSPRKRMWAQKICFTGQAASSARWAEADPIKTCLAFSRSPNYALKEGKKRGTSKGRERRRRKKGRGRNRLVDLEPGPPGYCYLGRSQWAAAARS